MPSITFSAKTAFININYLFTSGVFLGEDLTVDLSFRVAPLLVSECLFFRVIQSFRKPYPIQNSETLKWAARSFWVKSGKSATCFLSASSSITLIFLGPVFLIANGFSAANHLSIVERATVNKREASDFFPPSLIKSKMRFRKSGEYAIVDIV